MLVLALKLKWYDKNNNKQNLKEGYLELMYKAWVYLSVKKFWANPEVGPYMVYFVLVFFFERLVSNPEVVPYTMYFVLSKF